MTHADIQPAAARAMSPRERVQAALWHREPDRVPADFMAAPEVWQELVKHLQPDTASIGRSEYFDPAWEAVMRSLEIDMRTVSYDQFCHPPESGLRKGARVDWWSSPSRSLPNRMWRQHAPDGAIYDIWGHRIQIERSGATAYESYAGCPLSSAVSLSDARNYAWPEPDWWDFSPVPGILAQLDRQEEHHIRFRMGSIFEVAWQLVGLEKFLTDLALDPAIPLYIMGRLTDVCQEITRRVLELAGERLDMVYFYDDVATQQSLLISKRMWTNTVRPFHARIVDLAKSFKKTVMYHCDGAVYPLIPELIDMGIDVLNPIQSDASGMDPRRLKAEFGGRLSFHGGIDITHTLPRGTPREVQAEVRERVEALGQGGGYILASTQHIQPDTPLANIFAMYDTAIRRNPGP